MTCLDTFDWKAIGAGLDLEGQAVLPGLRQHAEGDCVFSLQAVLLLKQPGKDFTGGELVMTEQRPRMQTRPMVVPLQKGDATVFAVHYRPFKGTKGYYRVNLRHAVSRVRGGERVAVELLFHDAR